MSIERIDINRCIGCKNCVNICPMDVFRFNEDMHKSVIAYPENCQTCGQCYVNCLGHSLALSGAEFAYPITGARAASVQPQNRRLYVSDTPKSRIVMPAIVGVLGLMFAHNAVIWGRKTAETRAAQAPTMTRMSTNQRWQHLTMFVSFILLVITGFSMLYFGSWFQHVLGVGTYLLGIIHRVAGVVLIGSGIYHIAYVMLTLEGRRLLSDIAPRTEDASNVWATLRYYLGRKPQKPKFGRFTYAEKAEYWALVLGTLSMSLTGTMMWAYLRTGRLLSAWWVSFAKSFHVYEAILATLAVVIWHFYQVFFDPDVSPMNLAWLDGKMPVDYYRREHELDAEGVREG